MSKYLRKFFSINLTIVVRFVCIKLMIIVVRSDMAKHGDGTRRNVTNQVNKADRIVRNQTEMTKACKIVA